MLWKPGIGLIYFLAFVYRVLWGNFWIRLILICAAVLVSLLTIVFSIEG